jgi:hypothetical protein
MLNDFIDKALAQIDDLAELKVTLVALHVLSTKGSATASVTERDLLAHAVVQSLSMPELTLKFALQKALSRGTLLGATLGDVPRYFANNEASRSVLDAIEFGSAQVAVQPDDAVQRAVRREIERLEAVEVLALSDADNALLDEWVAQGYTQAEILAAVRAALHEPRPKSAPPRRVNAIKKTLTQHPPEKPSDYYRVTIARTVPPSEEVVALRELKHHRWPNAREFALVRSAVALFGVRAVVDGLSRLAQGGTLDVEALLPFLTEQEDAQLAFERSRASVDVAVKELLVLYESVLGTPPTEYIAREIKSVYDNDVKEMTTWRTVLEYAAHQNKKEWRYIRALLLNPSPNVFVPAAVNATAQLAFEEYRRRVGRLDPVVANEINAVAQTVSDEVRWRAAFDAAAKANALNWNYIKKVLTSDAKPQTTSDGKRKRATSKQAGSSYRREQVEYSDERRAAARERAKQRLAEKQKNAGATRA